MKNNKTISILVLCIAVLSLFASLTGIFSNQGNGEYKIQSIHNETVTIYGKGIYHNDSVTTAVQGIAQDVVTLVLGVPLLLISLYFSRKGSMKGRLLLTGTLGYFLYTYISYTFLWMYNPLFLVYVILMSASFFAFTLSMMSFDIEKLKSAFSKKLPVKLLGGFQIFFAVAICMLWLGRIVPPLLNGAAPSGLEHYTTLVIQGMDLGLVVPVAFMSGVLLLKMKPIGYLISSVIIMKGITMGTALTAMVIGQACEGVRMGFADMVIFPLFTLVIVYCMVMVLKNVNEYA